MLDFPGTPGAIFKPGVPVLFSSSPMLDHRQVAMAALRPALEITPSSDLLPDSVRCDSVRFFSPASYKRYFNFLLSLTPFFPTRIYPDTILAQRTGWSSGSRSAVPQFIEEEE